ncbi:S41 family peptidase [Gilvibacter sediminis]|uniref:S41 family peptidase n=1 Tax=Gilvibacter sediminis TaxID=379071 RepID=UPI002350B77D|nr:S41 family peptidase [Gilvibacter sediminis]MDC7999059.1 S41 family peptidase [Gilvibacter sediminis]
MRKLSLLSAAVLLVFTTVACFEDQDDNLTNINGNVAFTINDFIWNGLNAFYLYKDDVPNLANDRFATVEEKSAFTASYPSPEAIFDDLLFQPGTVDRFSFLVDDYIALEQQFQGITKNNGMEFGLVFYPDSEFEIFGYVRYVLPGTSAEAEGLTRGVVFNTVNGQQINNDNFRGLFSADTYTIGLATFDGDTVTPTGEEVTLTKAEYTENPILVAETLNVSGQNIGYLMYNGFTSNFDEQLNDAFGQFAANGITDLVLDLRYNPGGSVLSAISLSSMITGQFTGEIFTTEQWNNDNQAFFEANDPERLVNRFRNDTRNGTSLNSLNLTNVYILTTRRSASASELVINGLDPWINVVQIGGTTTGKFTASTTLYDSENFGRTGANPDHTYAMQPLILKSLNADGVTDYFDGLVPDTELREDYSNLGTLGDVNEPLLAEALNQITGAGFGAAPKTSGPELKEVSGRKEQLPFFNEMIYDLPLPKFTGNFK